MADFDLLSGLRLEFGHGRDNTNPSFSRKVRGSNAAATDFIGVDATPVMIAPANPNRLEILISAYTNDALIGFNDTDLNFLVPASESFRTSYYTGEIWAARAGGSDTNVYVTEVSEALPPPAFGFGLLLSTGDYLLLTTGGKILIGT